MDLQIEKEKLKEFFSDKKNCRQFIIAVIITVFIAMTPTIANIPITYAEKTSPDGKYKLVAQYPLREGVICSLSMAGSGDEAGTLILKSSDGREINKTGLVMQEFQPEAIKWHSEYVEMNHIKWYYDGRLPDNIKIIVTDKGIYAERK